MTARLCTVAVARAALTNGARDRGQLGPYLNALPEKCAALALRTNVEFVTPNGLPFPRVWSPHLSVLDAEVDGERVVWHVPAKAASDTSDVTPGAAESFPYGTDNLEKPNDIAQRGAGPRREKVNDSAQRHTAWRPSTLAAWLREQEGGRP